MITKKGIFLIVLLGLLNLPIIVFAQPVEYTLKAAFLERFTRFVDWPVESGIADTSNSFVLGVIGKNPFGAILERVYSTQKIKNKKVKILHISNPNEIHGCNLLFISESKKKELDKILSLTKNKPILTVSDTKGFAKEGVLINFYLAGNKVRFEINESAVRTSGLSMSYLLLKSARIIKRIINEKG